MTQKQKAALVIAGAGSLGAAESGAAAVVREVFDVVREGGASAGSLESVGGSLGIKTSALWLKFLSRGDLEDWHVPVGPLKVAGLLTSKRFGLMAGNRMYAAMREVVGDVRMCELPKPCRIVVGNLDDRKIQIVDSQLGLIEMAPGGKITVIDSTWRLAYAADCMRASSAVPFLIDAWPVMPGHNQLFTDGGTGANVPTGLWDDFPDLTTVVIKFKDDGRRRPVKNLIDFAMSIFDMRQDAANSALATHKKNVITIEIETSGNAMDFSLKAAEVEKMRADGEASARRALKDFLP